MVSQWVPKSVSFKDFMQTSFVGTPEDCMKLLQPYANLGVTQFMLFFGNLSSIDGLRLFAEKVVQKMK
jgi:alkanesulfonate monooxygenase SsuD/methylene tetrahydromethanopterin reductase-like flavin-dependent oxidoreductase (luciferase family)